MESSSAGTTSCEDNKKVKDSRKNHAPLDKVNVVDHDSTGGSCLMRSTSLVRDMILDPPINDKLESDIVKTQCNLDSTCSQKNKKKRKKKKKKKAQNNHNDQTNVQGDTPSIKDDSFGTNSCCVSAADADGKSNMKIAQLPELTKTQKKKMRKKNAKNDHNAQTDIQRDTSLIKDDFVGTNSCQEPAVDTEGKTDLNTAPGTGLSKSGKKKMRKKKAKNNHNSHTDVQGDTSSVKDNCVETNSVLESAADTDGKTIIPLSGLGKSQKKRKRKKKAKNGHNTQPDVQGDTSSTKDDSVVINSCLESVVDTNVKTDLKPAPPLGLAKSERKKMRKKKAKKNHNTQMDVQGHASSIKDDSVGTNSCLESAVDTNGKINLKIAPQSAVDTKTEKKKMRKKRRLNASVINDESHVPLGEMLFTKLDENALVSEQQSDSPGSPSANMMKKHENNGEGSLLLVENENILNYDVNDNFKIYKRKRRKSLISEENVEHVTVAAQTSSDSKKGHSFEISEKEVESVQAVEIAPSVDAVENVLTKKTSFNCSAGDFACVEGSKIMETKKDVDLDVQTKENLSQVSHSSVGIRVGPANKKLLILDVNGLLADIIPYGHMSLKPDIIIAHKSVFKRPFCDDFLQFCFEKFNVGVWSSRTKKNVDMVIDFLMGDSRRKLLFCWHQSHCTDTGLTTVENSSKPLVLKEVRKLWDKLVPGLPWNKGEYDESNTLLLDDSPYKALRNPPHTAIFPYSYQYKNAGDSSLGPGGDLRVYLERLAEASNVQDFVAQNPFGQRAITESNPSWGFYQKCLSVASCQSQDFASSSGNVD